MTAIGEQLRATREARGLSLDQVADDTNIAKRYLSAMEEENFSIFPGDPYIVGFLRNYAEYLGLDASGLLQAFRGIRIQEQPVPIDKLLPSRKLPFWPFIAIGVAAILGLGAYLFSTYAPKVDPADSATVAIEPVQYTMDGSSFEKRLYEGDTILVQARNKTYRLLVASIKERVGLETPAGTMSFMLGEEITIDLDKTDQARLQVFVSDFQKNEADKGAMIRFMNPDAQAENESVAATTEAASDAGASQAEPSPAVPDRPASQEAIIFSGRRSPHPFIVNVTFRNYAMFRHEVDRGEREERYYHRGDQITTTANNTAKIWTSNAAASKLTIQASGGASADIELGQAGEVAVKQIRWVQLDDGTWNLNVFNLN
ncbi:MAG: helix-turn-helix domain-containing protein [Clostridia bacterium]|jgi:cytoskeletal protein RodZ|nr:helix-turn-helix domain-containing protein [Spirochaetia bacterium]